MNLALGEALARAGIRGTKSFEQVEHEMSRREADKAEKAKKGGRNEHGQAGRPSAEPKSA